MSFRSYFPRENLFSGKLSNTGQAYDKGTDIYKNSTFVVLCYEVESTRGEIEETGRLWTRIQELSFGSYVLILMF